ncbi:MAG: hypothetical protein AAFQ63_18015 [Cyanobacteria bacterium J06621_11]
MPDKQKVTLYLSDALHRQFKIRSAVDGETMSSMAQRAIEFYLENSETVESVGEAYGQTHQVHSCPKCSASVTLKDSKLSLVDNHASPLLDELESISCISRLSQDVPSNDVDNGVEASCTEPGGRESSERSDEGELITC